MAGISSKAAGTIQNKEKIFQGQRFDDELDLNWVQFKWRNHDPQIGRFIEIDPLSEKYVYNSTYAFSENHVTTHVELEGLEKFPIHTGGNKREIEKAQHKRWRYDYQDPSSSQNNDKKQKKPENNNGGSIEFYTPEISANLEVGAVARLGVKGFKGKGGESVIFAGVKDNEGYFGAKNLNTEGFTLFNSGGGNFMGSGVAWEEKKVKDETGNYQLNSDKKTTSVGFIVAASRTIENNYITNERTETKSIDIGAGLGLGLVVNLDLSIPFFKQTTKLK